MKPGAPLSYGDGMDAPGCPCGPDSACCGGHEYGAEATRQRELEASEAAARFAARHRPAALDEVCCGYRCTAATTEACCGWALCADCYRDHRHDCEQLQDDVREELYPQGCDHTTAPGAVCHVCAGRVEAEVRRRAEGGL